MEEGREGKVKEEEEAREGAGCEGGVPTSERQSKGTKGGYHQSISPSSTYAYV